MFQKWHLHFLCHERKAMLIIRVANSFWQFLAFCCSSSLVFFSTRKPSLPSSARQIASATSSSDENGVSSHAEFPSSHIAYLPPSSPTPSFFATATAETPSISLCSVSTDSRGTRSLEKSLERARMKAEHYRHCSRLANMLGSQRKDICLPFTHCDFINVQHHLNSLFRIR